MITYHVPKRSRVCGGSALAHRLPIKQLRTVFALLLYGFAVRMLVGVW